MSALFPRATVRRYCALSTALLMLLFFLSGASCASQTAARAKYVFLMIGDGMAESQRIAAERFAAGERAASPS